MSKDAKVQDDVVHLSQEYEQLPRVQSDPPNKIFNYSYHFDFLSILGKLILITLISCFVLRGYAEPSKIVIKSCHLQKAADSTVKFTELNVRHDYFHKKITQCPQDLHSNIQGVETYSRFFYQEHCGNKEFLHTGKRTFDLEKSINHSLSSEIKPYGVTSSSNWYLIQYGHEKYICMTSSLGENGWAAAIGQYYIVENGFDENKPLNVYFYFFDKKFIDDVRARGWINE